MLKNIFLFELSYRLQRWPTYVYFTIIFLLCFFIVTSPNTNLGGAVGTVYANSPYTISAALLVVSALMPLITSAIMGVAVVRDFDHGLAEIIFSTPVHKGPYLLGKFLGSFTVVIFVGFAALPGLLCGYALGEYLPWEVAWRNNGILTNHLWFYLQPFLFLMATNLFISGSLFFMSGALGRQNFVIYTQGALMVLLYQLGLRFLQDSDSQTLASLIDPFGIQAFVNTTRYWSPLEKNSAVIPMAGTILANRLLWCSLGLIALATTYFLFSRNIVQKSLLPARHLHSHTKTQKPTSNLALVAQTWTRLTQTLQIWHGIKFYFRMVCREIPFIAIVISGMLVFFINALKLNPLPDSSSYPYPAVIIKLLDSFTLFLMILALFYSGELIWAERRLRVNPISDALPTTNLIILSSKLGALILIYICLLTLLLTGGIIVSLAYGYYQIPLGIYAGVLFGVTLTFLILFTILFFFVQVVVNNKFVGFFICITLFVAEILLVNAGFDWDLLLFASGSLNVYSDMNGFGHFLLPFVWSRIYWMSFAVLLFLFAVARWPRTHIHTKQNKWIVLRPLAATAALIFLASGSLIYYNTRIVTSPEQPQKISPPKSSAANTYPDNKNAQPKIVETSLQIHLHPSSRAFQAKGHYVLKNKTATSLSQLDIWFRQDADLHVNSIRFDRTTHADSSTRTKHYPFTITPPLLPGDSMRMDFDITYTSPGFKMRRSNTQLAYNGTFLDESYFPSIGYNRDSEISSTLPQANFFEPELPEATEVGATQFHRMGRDTDRMRLDIVVSTEENQRAVAPGTLQRQWIQNGRPHFHYKMNTPIANRYAVLSAQYESIRDRWKNVDLEVYYHPQHHYNVAAMLTAMKDALTYCESNFGTYPYNVLRIAEFPRYQLTAPSTPTLIPFSEGGPFMLKITEDTDDLNLVRYLTLRMVAYQWWGHHLLVADVKGGALASEGLASYTALMALRQSLPPQAIGKYLRYELNNYLTGRSKEKRQEQPLTKVGNQEYLHAHKAALALFLLQDVLGDSAVNKAARSFHQNWAGHEAPYPTATDLLLLLNHHAPDSIHPLMADLFDRIIIYENRTTHAHYQPQRDGKFEVTTLIHCEKKMNDQKGVESQIPMKEWIDVGAYNAKKQLIYLKKHQLREGDNIVTFTLTELPARVGVDPLHKLIDRHVEDNTVVAKEAVDLTGLPILND